MWGVDVDTTRVAIAAIWRGEKPRPPAFTTVEIPNERRSSGVSWDPGDMHYMAAHTASIAAAFAEFHAPGLIWVEQASGARPSPKLLYCAGAVMAGLGRVLPSTPIYTITSGAWKVGSMGKGNGNMHDKKKLVSWAQAQGLPNGDSDLAAALGIALGGASQVLAGA